MIGELEEAVESLRQGSSAMAHLDPGDLAAMDDALRARGASIERLVAAARDLPPESAEALVQAAGALAEASTQGAELLLRLKLARAAVESELEALARGQRFLHGLAGSPEPGRSVDYSG